MNHPFVDGNKRAGTAAMIAFLSDNGWSFDATADDAEPIILQLAAGTLDKPAFTEWARKHMHEKPKMELREFFQRLTPQHLQELDAAFRQSPGSEHKTTFHEAETAIPLMGFIDSLGTNAEAEGKRDTANTLRGQWQLLIAIYRIAEDMGYEW